MKSTYNTHVRKLQSVRLPGDAPALKAVLRQSLGSRILVRVIQDGHQFDELAQSGPDLAATLIRAGVDIAAPFDAEILIRDPLTTALDSTEQFHDRHDRNAVHWNGERGTGHPPPGPQPSLRGAPMFLRDNAAALDLIDLHRGSVFLILNGPSFDLRAQQLLANRPGVLTFGVNNGAHRFRPDLWTCVDDPARFLRSIWADGRITKFVPMAHYQKPIWDRQRDAPSDERVKDFPNVIGYRRNEAFCPAQWLIEDTINWGNHTSRGGGRSVMLVALRIAHLLGFRRVYLVGCDFHMSPESRYWFDEQRSARAIANNEHSYRILEAHFKALRPEFDRAGFEVFNCNPDSRLQAFP
ncbi:MAG: hypothetical protein ACI8UO_006802, partial [Verrucomicrobiales bacterium]